MTGSMINPPDLTIYQAKADLITAESCLSESSSAASKIAKYLRGQAGYHLQQACEKMIKIQVYVAAAQLDYHKIYRHDLADLASYAKSLGVQLILPKYIDDRLSMISSWEAEGRYDVHIVVRTDTLQRCLLEVNAWYEQLLETGFN